MSQREARLNLEIAGEQRRIAHASKRDSTAMKTISLMGALFLPGTYLASVFSMTFFNFQSGWSPLSPSHKYTIVHTYTMYQIGADPVISNWLWVYFIITVPLTIIIVGSWIWYDRRKEARYADDDKELEGDIEQMEVSIMKSLRRRTMSKANTWNSTISPAP